MELLTGKIENLSGKDIHAVCDFLSKKFSFTGVDYHAVNGEWVITAEGREAVVAKVRKSKEADSADAE